MDLKTLQSNHDMQKWLSNPTTVAVLQYLRANCPFIGRGRPSDANVVVNNEGAIQGFFSAVDAIPHLATPPQERTRHEWQPYQPAAFPSPESPKPKK